jgi:hypothetical protein
MKFMTFNRSASLFAATVLLMTSCLNDLDPESLGDKVKTQADVYKTNEDYKRGLAKIYATFALSGQQGPSGQPDIAGIDEGFGNYLRQYWNCQQLTTDEAVIGWNDATIKDFHWHTWTPTDVFIAAVYSRIMYTITLSNEFIRVTNGINDEEIKAFNAEARFIRALAYYHALDLFGNPPFVTEADKPGSYFPKQIERADLFDYIEGELTDIEEEIIAPRTEYGRADQAALWMLQAKLYLNAEVYINEAKYTEAITALKKVIGAGYSLSNNYQHNFVADNHTSPEMIFAINYDYLNTQSYGGMVYLIHAPVGGGMDAPGMFGIDGGWGGIRTTKNLVRQFDIDVTALNGNLGTLSNWGLVGNATTNGWNGPDMRMYSSANNVYTLFANLSAGEMKFRFNNDWGQNFGDNGANGSLEDGGANIAIPQSGTYLVTLNLNNNTYSVVQAGDKRAMFYSAGQSLEIEDIAKFTDGYAVTKFRNRKLDGSPIKADPQPTFVNTDYPMFRLADAYLMYAEAVLRGGQGGSTADALTYVNAVRQRAYGNNSGNISQVQLTLDFILNERSRELYWEGHRRTDLIRFGKFTGGTYLWPWKGKVAAGTSTPDHLQLFPIPAADLSANPTLKQNVGY